MRCAFRRLLLTADLAIARSRHSLRRQLLYDKLRGTGPRPLRRGRVGSQSRLRVGLCQQQSFMIYHPWWLPWPPVTQRTRTTRVWWSLLHANRMWPTPSQRRARFPRTGMFNEPPTAQCQSNAEREYPALASGRKSALMRPHSRQDRTLRASGLGHRWPQSDSRLRRRATTMLS